jgi:hypothetical protein
MIQLLKKYKTIIVVALVILFVVAIIFLQYKRITTLKEDLSISKANEKAFIIENKGLKDENRVFQLTIEQLNYYNDSLNTKMNEVRKQLKIKDKNLKQLQYLLSEAKKTDTIFFRDTIFKYKGFKLDTLIGDSWYNLKLGLQYPNVITTTPTFKSEKFIVVNSKRETVNPPKKCAILRWFQKKHTIIEMEVVEKNPYIDNKQQRFIEIIE